MNLGLLNAGQMLVPIEPLEFWRWSRGQSWAVLAEFRIDPFQDGSLAVSEEGVVTVSGQFDPIQILSIAPDDTTRANCVIVNVRSSSPFQKFCK